MRQALLITNDYAPAKGGIAQVLYCIASALPPDAISVLAQADAAAAAFDAGQAFRTWRERYDKGGLRALLSTFRFGRRTARLLREVRPDLLYIAKPWPFGLIGLYFLYRRGLPYVVHTFGNEVIEPRSPMVASIRARILRNAERVIVISAFTRDTVVALGVAPERTAMMRPKIDPAPFERPVDLDTFRREEGLEGKRLLLTVGRLVERKGMDRVIAALPEIARAFPDVVYAVIGTGKDEARLRRLAAERGVADRVRLLGDRDPVPFYQACDVFVMPSRHIIARGDVEGFGIVYLEANACGKPVVGGASGGVPDAVLDEQTGLLVPPDDVPALAAAVNRLLGDPELARRLGECGRARVLREFTPDKYAEEFIRLVLEPGPGDA